MVEGAGAPNGGLILDIVHIVNIGIPYEAIAKIPRRFLVNVELNDGSLPGRPNHDPGARLFCGEGSFDIQGFVRAVRQTGYNGTWAAEVYNREFVGLPLDELNRRAFETTATALASAR